jgi:polar amino acid transport system substrate-binding protein
MRRSIVAALIAGTVLLTACGGDDDDSSTTEADDTATETTAAAGTGTTAAADSATTAAGGGTGNDCTAGKTLDEGVLTVATATPAFEPWVVGDDPTTGEGFESAVAFAVAEAMGFSAENVAWVRTGFDEAIQPGPKNFDFNLQQYTITPERSEVVTFSDPYYSTNQAVVGFADGPAAGVTTIEELRGLKLGAQAGTTSFDFINDVIQPESAPFAYNDNVDAKAALESQQIDAIVLDLPTAFFVSAVEIEGTSVIGQFPADAAAQPDQFGLLFEKDNPLVECVNAALAALTESGDLAAIEREWLADATGAPVIEVG